MPPSREEFVLDNGNKFYIRRYDPFLALRILGDVQKKFLAPLAGIMEAGDEKSPERLENIMKSIEKISMNLDGDGLVSLCKTVLNGQFISVSIDGDAPQLLDEGSLNLATDSVYDVVSLVVEVLRINYQDLFTRGKDLIGRVQSDTVIH